MAKYNPLAKLATLAKLAKYTLLGQTLYHLDKYNKYIYINSLYTVSYTHLRAHETVLDLVCRLLLEKKKKKKTTKKKKQKIKNYHAPTIIMMERRYVK